MSAQESGSRPSIGKITRRGMRRHFDEISRAVYIQLLVHAAIVAPQVFCESVGGKLPDILAVGASLAIIIFILIPLRFYTRQTVRRVYYRHSGHTKREEGVYTKWLTTGLLRYFRGSLWGLPFIACVVYFTVFRTILDATTFELPIHWLAMQLAGNPENGTGNVNLAMGIIAAVVALFGLLFAYGWWRDLPFEYLPVRSIGARNTLRWSRRILKNNRKEMFGNVCVNFMLSLPAIVGFGAVLGMYAIKNVNFSYGITVTVTQVRKLFTQPVPQMVLLELLVVFAVLYLPLCILRKCRNAAMMGRLLRHTHHHHSAESESKPEKAADSAPKEDKPAEDKEKDGE